MAAAQRAAEASAQMTPENVDAGVADQPTDDLSASASPMQGPTGVELPDRNSLRRRSRRTTPRQPRVVLAPRLSTTTRPDRRTGPGTRIRARREYTVSHRLR